MGIGVRVAAWLEDWAGAPVEILGVPVDHHERVVLDAVLAGGRRVVAKGDLDRRRSAREATVLRAAHGSGVPVPAVLAQAAGPPAVLVLAHIDGRWLAPDAATRAWSATGAAIRRLHDVVAPGLAGIAGRSTWVEGLEAVAARWEARSRAAGLDARAGDAVRTATRRLVRSQPTLARSVTLHGDCAPVHVRVDEHDRVVGLLDLGDAVRGDPAWDLAVLTLRSPGRLPAVLDGYGATPDLRHRVEDAWPVYGALRLMAEVGWLSDHGFDPARAIAEAGTASQTLLS